MRRLQTAANCCQVIAWRQHVSAIITQHRSTHHNLHAVSYNIASMHYNWLPHAQFVCYFLHHSLLIVTYCCVKALGIAYSDRYLVKNTTSWSQPRVRSCWVNVKVEERENQGETMCPCLFCNLVFCIWQAINYPPNYFCSFSHNYVLLLNFALFCSCMVTVKFTQEEQPIWNARLFLVPCPIITHRTANLYLV